jgi:hypothetical protein
MQPKCGLWPIKISSARGHQHAGTKTLKEIEMKTHLGYKLTLWTFLIPFQSVQATQSTPIDPGTLCERLQILEETLVFDKTGTRIIDIYSNDRGPGGSSLGQSEKEDGIVCGRGSSSGISSSSFDGPIFFHHEWSVKEDGTLTVTYEQGSGFSGRGREAKLKDSTGRKTAAVKDFQTVSWTSPFHKNQRVVVRLTPTLRKSQHSRELGKFPLYLSDATIFDGSGKLWTANLTAYGDYIGVLTVAGSVVMSFQPFTEGKKIGKAHGKEIRFTLPDGKSVLLKSAEPLLPGDISSDVYVHYDPNMRAKSFGSQSVSSSDNAAETLSRLKQHAQR